MRQGKPLTIGVDVSKAKLDVAFGQDGDVEIYPNDTRGLMRLIRDLKKLKLRVVAFEPSGGCESALTKALVDAEIPCAMVDARRTRYFAKSHGFEAKTDAIDARVIAAFARSLPTTKLVEISVEHQEFRALVSRRRQLADIRSKEKCHLEDSAKSTIRDIKEHIASLAKRIAKVEKLIAEAIQAHPCFKAIYDLLIAEAGVGDITAQTLIALLPELGKADRREIAALVGVAPIANDSGAFKGKRTIRGGRADVKKVLYMAALIAGRYHPKMKEFRDRLKAKGNAPKVVITAVMRKLIVYLNAITRDEIYRAEGS